MVTVIWTLSLLLNHRDVLRKVQEEINTHIGKDRRVEESDIKNLTYLQAVIKETFRLYPPGPVNVLRVAMEDCILSNGYHVPAGTRLFTNIWKIHHDERIWPNANEFIPERFLTTHKHIDFKGQHFELIPFGAGRRACPGISLALHVVHLTLATLLQGFDMHTVGDEAVDMTETSGFTNIKVTPLKIILTPRLDEKFYGL